MSITVTRHVVALSVLLMMSSAAYADLPELVAEKRTGVVGVGTYEALRAPQNELSGTGFVVGNGTLVITNHHVAEPTSGAADPAQLVVFMGRGKEAEVRPARIVAQDRFHDLALLRMEGPPGTPLRFDADQAVREGQAIAVIGFPIGIVLGLYPSTNAGIVSSVSPIAIPQSSTQSLSAAQIRRLREPFEVYQLDLIAYPGNSGSPVFDVTTGHIIGVVNSVLAREAKEGLLKNPSAITYAIPVRHVEALLREQ